MLWNKKRNDDVLVSRDRDDSEETKFAVCQTPSKPKDYGIAKSDQDDGTLYNNAVKFNEGANKVFYDALDGIEQDRHHLTWLSSQIKQNLDHNSQGILTPHSPSPNKKKQPLESMLFRGIMSSLFSAQSNVEKNKSGLEKPSEYGEDGNRTLDLVQYINDLWSPKLLCYGIILSTEYSARLAVAPPLAPLCVGGDYYQTNDDGKSLMADGKEFLHEHNYKGKVSMAFVKYNAETNSSILVGKRWCFSTILTNAYHIKNLKLFHKEEKESCIPTGDLLFAPVEQYKMQCKTFDRSDPVSGVDMIQVTSSPIMESDTANSIPPASALAATLVPETPVAQLIGAQQQQNGEVLQFQLWQKEHSERQLGIQEQLSQALLKSTNATARANETTHEQSKTINALLQRNGDNPGTVMSTPKRKNLGKKPPSTHIATPVEGIRARNHDESDKYYGMYGWKKGGCVTLENGKKVRGKGWEPVG